MLPKEKALEIIERTGLTDIVEKTFMQLPCSGISGVAKCTYLWIKERYTITSSHKVKLMLKQKMRIRSINVSWL